jgi:hypothetical protein
MTAAFEVCTKDKQHKVVHFFVYEGMIGAEICRELAAEYGQNCLPQWSVYEWIEMFKSRRTSVVDTDSWGRPSTHTQTKALERWILEIVGQMLRKLLQGWAIILLVLGAYLDCSNHYLPFTSLYYWSNLLHWSISVCYWNISWDVGIISSTYFCPRI